MALTIYSYCIAIPILLTLLGLLAYLARHLCIHHLLTNRHFYLRELERYSNEARFFHAETAAIQRHFAQDVFLDEGIRISCMRIVNEATEYETGISIALASWEDVVSPERAEVGDVESVSGSEGGSLKGESAGAGMGEGITGKGVLGRRQRREIVELMRKGCAEGMEKRRALSPQLQCMLMITSRYSMSDTMSGALPVTDSDDEYHKRSFTGDSISVYHIPALEFEDEKMFAREVQSGTESEERSVIPPKYRNIAQPPPAMVAVSLESSLAVPPRRIGSPVPTMLPPMAGGMGNLEGSEERTVD